MSAAVGAAGSGPPVCSGTARPAGKLSISSQEFRELVAKALRPDAELGSAGRSPVPGGPTYRREESEPHPPQPTQSSGRDIGSAECEGEGEPVAAGEANPSWQPGALDPLALFGVGGLTSPASSPVVSAPPGLDPLVGELLRSIAWGGDRRRGTARIELGSGRYRGTTLLVDVVGDRLHIDLEAPAGVDAAELGARLSERFEARGLRVESLLVR